MNKQHILEEIRRTAAANDGVALGRKRFEQETGIRETDWAGRFWVRWSEAVREAGLTPQRMQEAYDDESLLAPLAALVRELGHFPVTNEMRIRKRRDPNFPNEKVYGVRFGPRAQLVQHLMEYCERIGNYSDVVEICRGIEASTPENAESIAPDASNHNDVIETGYVYLALMKVGKEKRFKIGKADIVGRRTKQIAVNLPEDLDLIHVIATDDAYGIEAYWHRRFDEKRRGGEWFVLAADDVKAFKRRKFM